MRDLIPHLRLRSQQLAGSQCRTAAQVVTALGAMQAQDYGSAVWAIGCRMAGSREADIEQAIRDRTIVRTWPMRGTLHFVPAEDMRWMLALCTPRVIGGTATRVRQLELDDTTFAKAARVLEKALQGGKPRTRDDTMAALEKAQISTLAMQGRICCGPRAGKQPTFVLLDEWLPRTRSLDREASLAELARRYFGGHGPATVQDFAWWSGLKISEAKAAVASVDSELERLREDGIEFRHAPAPTAAPGQPEAYLLPGFDEYLIGYKDRGHVLETAHASKIVPGSNGVFLPMLVSKGRVIGTWKRTISKDGVRVALAPFAPLTKSTLKAFDVAAARYSQFLGNPSAVAGASAMPS